jgi:hypothetical protein
MRTVKASISGTAKPTAHGKRAVAISIYERGKAFSRAADALNIPSQSQADTLVQLHLFCQATELVLKALLLIQNYEEFKPKLEKKLHHDLAKTAKKTAHAYGTKVGSKRLEDELQLLTSLYKQKGGMLRYSGLLNIFHDARKIPYTLTKRRLAALLKLVDRKLYRKPA